MRFPNRTVRDRITEIDRIWRDLNVVEDEAGLPETRQPDPGFTPVAHAWAAGKDLEDVLLDEDMTGRRLRPQRQAAHRPAPPGRRRGAAARDIGRRPVGGRRAVPGRCGGLEHGRIGCSPAPGAGAAPVSGSICAPGSRGGPRTSGPPDLEVSGADRRLGGVLARGRDGSAGALRRQPPTPIWPWPSASWPVRRRPGWPCRSTCSNLLADNGPRGRGGEQRRRRRGPGPAAGLAPPGGAVGGDRRRLGRRRGGDHAGGDERPVPAAAST